MIYFLCLVFSRSFLPSVVWMTVCVILCEVLDAVWEGVAYQLWEDCLELEVEPLSGFIIVGGHVKAGIYDF